MPVNNYSNYLDFLDELTNDIFAFTDMILYEDNIDYFKDLDMDGVKDFVGGLLDGMIEGNQHELDLINEFSEYADLVNNPADYDDYDHFVFNKIIAALTEELGDYVGRILGL